MRRQHHAPDADAVEQGLRDRPRKDVSASASSTAAAPLASTASHQLAGFAADAQTGPDHHRIEPLVGQKSAKPFAPSNGLTMMAVRCAALIGNRLALRGHADQPGADAQRAPRRQPRRAGGMRRSRHHHAMAAGIFVRLGFRPGKIRAPQRRACFRTGGRSAQAASRNADIGQHDFAAQIAPRQQKMRRLLAEEGDGEIGRAPRSPADLAGVAVNAAGHIDRHDRDMGIGSRASTSRAHSRHPAAATGPRRTAHPRPARRPPARPA